MPLQLLGQFSSNSALRFSRTTHSSAAAPDAWFCCAQILDAALTNSSQISILAFEKLVDIFVSLLNELVLIYVLAVFVVSHHQTASRSWYDLRDTV